MIQLNSVLPEDVITQAKYTVTLQETLMSIEPSTIQKSFQIIFNLPLIRSYQGVKNIANNILLAAQYRPFSLESLAELSIKLNNAGKESDDNKLNELNSVFLTIPVKILDEKWKVAFLYVAHNKGLFSDDELFTAIKKYFNENPILKNKPFWKNNCRQHFLFFQWFAPLFEKMDIQLYEETKNSFFECYSKRNLASNYDNYMLNFEQLRENNWQKYKELLNNHYENGSIADIIKKDKVDEMHQMLLQMGSNSNKKSQHIQFEQRQKPDDSDKKSDVEVSPEEAQLKTIIDSRIECTMFEFVTMLSRKPTLAHFAAFCGSEKCFDFLLKHGANLELNDYGKRNSLHFAIAGGNMNIIQKVESVVKDYKGATRIAAEYHRFELFKMFLDTSHANLKANNIENGSIFHGIAAANHIKMILFCLEQGCDCNLKDGDGVCIELKKMKIELLTYFN